MYVAWAIICTVCWIIAAKALGFLDITNHALIAGYFAGPVLAIIPFLLTLRWSRRSVTTQPSPEPLSGRAALRKALLLDDGRQAFLLAHNFTSCADREQGYVDIVRHDIRTGRIQGAKKRLSLIENPELHSALEARIANMIPLDKPAKQARPGKGIAVTVLDNFDAGDRDSGQYLSGFESPEKAREYAERRIQSSVEELRKPGDDAETLSRKWQIAGTDVAIDGEGPGQSMVEKFAHQPASPGSIYSYWALAPKSPGDSGMSMLSASEHSLLVSILIVIFGTLFELTFKPVGRAIANGFSRCFRRHQVVLIDNLYRNNPQVRHSADRFATYKAAEAYAADRVRASIDSFRIAGQREDDLYKLWRAEGEDVIINKGADNPDEGMGESRFADLVAVNDPLRS